MLTFTSGNSLSRQAMEKRPPRHRVSVTGFPWVRKVIPRDLARSLSTGSRLESNVLDPLLLYIPESYLLSNEKIPSHRGGGA